MELLVDENLSPQLPRLLANLFPGIAHVRGVGLMGRTDEEVWEHARTNNFIVSKDSDFQQRSLLYGHPPKLVWLRSGNCTRQQLVHLIASHEQEIYAFDAASFESVLVFS